MKFLFLLFLFFILLGPILRFAFRMFIGKKVVEMQNQYYKNQAPQQRPEGEIRVETPKANRQKRTDSQEGQYIDFEEVK